MESFGIAWKIKLVYIIRQLVHPLISSINFHSMDCNSQSQKTRWPIPAV